MLYSPSYATFRFYRKELARFTVWTAYVRRVALTDVGAADIVAFRRWLRDQDGKEHWPKGWKPFRTPLSQVSRTEADRIIHTFFCWLRETGEIVRNPYMDLPSYVDSDLDGNEHKQRLAYEQKIAIHRHERIDRIFPEALWKWLLSIFDDRVEWPAECALWGTERRSRLRCIFHFGYYAGLRIGEMARAAMSDFEMMDGPWIFNIRNMHGRHERMIVPTAAMTALAAYRSERRLPPSPEPTEDQIPLISSLRHRTHTFDPSSGSGMSTAGIAAELRLALKMFALAAPNSDWRDRLNDASSQWLRRTLVRHAIGADINIRTLQAQLRLASLSALNSYYPFPEFRERSDELERLHSSNNEES